MSSASTFYQVWNIPTIAFLSGPNNSSREEISRRKYPGKENLRNPVKTQHHSNVSIGSTSSSSISAPSLGCRADTNLGLNPGHAKCLQTSNRSSATSISQQPITDGRCKLLSWHPLCHRHFPFPRGTNVTPSSPRESICPLQPSP